MSKQEKIVQVSVEPIKRWWLRSAEVKELEKKLADKEKELKKLTKQQEMRDLITDVVNEAFEKNKRSTRLTCWHCDRAIEEDKGYSTWLGVRLHTTCSDAFREKMRPVLATMKDAHSNYMWDGMPVFTVEPKK